ncbi:MULTISPECIES: hypothetical protein [Pseudomonas]|uniref:Lipoprotein n=1 Tax=Pseudomonas muyukensis TaxID=2842357 RepID=A0ABX8MBI1_9PSED|nr:MULTISPECIES: hypothetical protein [Pseudomonas]MCO7521715.1 hypothetical protein [Pseudomonas sp. 1]MCO7539779.1 hypothetical protein [Pseudomonas sp. VA159-2]QXH36233.1 hypothetical protein KSS95_05215 [Pseudomonas muyukensis]
MVKQLPVMIVAVLLGACSSSKGSDADPAQPPKGGCYQSQWQAETVPVINKRLGPDGLEKYDDEHQRKAPGCP